MNLHEASKNYHNLIHSNRVINLTKTQLVPEVSRFLSLGPHFAININGKKDIINTIANVENILKTSSGVMDNNKQIEIRNNTNNILHSNIKNKTSNNILSKQFFNDYKSTKKFIIENKNIMILGSDKTKQTVLINKEDYMTKMGDLITNNDVYKILSNNPLEKYNTKIKTYLDKLLKNNFIDKKDFNKLYNKHYTTPRMFGLVKTHKTGMPIRPIISNVNGPNCNLSRFLNPSLNELNNDNPYDVRNSIEVIDKLNGLKIEYNEVMLSFDVISMFTNIPIDKTLKIIENMYDEKIKCNTVIKNRSMFIEGLKLCLEYSYFLFNNNFYRQMNGLPMGGSLSTNISGIYLNDLIKNAINKTGITPKFLVKYVDDILVIMKKNEVEVFLKCLNSFSKSIQFTTEFEINNMINFLDITLIRKDTNLSTKWYKKEISSNTLINFYSNHPTHIKINTARNYIVKAIKTTSFQYRDQIKNKISKILSENLFPNHLIKELWNKCLYEHLSNRETHSTNSPVDNINFTHDNSNKPTVNENIDLPVQINDDKPNSISKHFKPLMKPDNDTNSNTQVSTNDNISPIAQTKNINNKPIYFSIPFLNNKTSTRIKNLFRIHLPENCSITLKPINKTEDIIYTNAKDKINKLMKTNIIYKIPCQNCNLSYIGQTKQFLADRIKQHSSNCTSKTEGQNKKTALSIHSTQENHKFNFDEVKILHNEENWFKRNIVESIYILKNMDNVVNFRNDAENISHYYNNVIQLMK